MERCKRINYSAEDPPHVRRARVHYEIERYFEQCLAEMTLTDHEMTHHCRKETHVARDSESYTEYLIYRNRTVAVAAYRYSCDPQRGDAAELLLSSHLL